jgi:subtilisin
MLVQPAYSQGFSTSNSDLQNLVSQNPDKYAFDSNGNVVEKGSYIITLKNEVFASITNDPKFNNPNQYLPSNIPELNAQVIPELLHEYTVETGTIIYEKVREYNGTETSSLSPLKIQGGSVDDVYSHAIKGFSIQNTNDISVFVNDPDIAAVEPDTLVSPAIEYMSKGMDRIDLDKATTTSYRPDGIENFPNIDVAVLDTRVLDTHPDLNVFRYQNFLASGTSTAPGQHGTHVAGIIAARDNLAGVVGVVPGARIWSLAVCPPTGSCSNSAVVSALDYLTANAASIEVANMSLGCSGGTFGQPFDCAAPFATDTAIHNAKNAGVTIVVSAQNSRRDSQNSMYCYNSSVICVSALADYDGKCGGLAPSKTYAGVGGPYTQRDDTLAYFSNWGNVVDLMAPGVDIISTDLPTGTVTNSQMPFIGSSPHGGYSLQSGTSMAAPYVSGAAALVKLNNPSFTPAQILTDLQTKAYPQTQSCDGSSKGGLSTGANARSSERILYVQPY